MNESAAIGGAVEARAIGAIGEITNTANARIETARQISQRLQDLRRRLVGDIDTNKAVGTTDVPTPVRAEVEELASTMDVLREIFEETLNDLAALERL